MKKYNEKYLEFAHNGSSMYIEYKGGDLTGEARIGRVKFSKTRKSIHYNGQTFETLKGRGFKANFFDIESGEYYWISDCKKTNYYLEVGMRIIEFLLLTSYSSDEGNSFSQFTQTK